jgi:hypothetical protein
MEKLRRACDQPFLGFLRQMGLSLLDAEGGRQVSLPAWSRGATYSGAGGGIATLSRCAITAITPADGHVSLSWSSVQGRRYHVHWSDDLANWMTVDDNGTPVVVDATGGLTLFEVANLPPTDRRFFRLRARPQPPV